MLPFSCFPYSVYLLKKYIIFFYKTNFNLLITCSSVLCISCKFVIRPRGLLRLSFDFFFDKTNSKVVMCMFVNWHIMRSWFSFYNVNRYWWPLPRSITSLGLCEMMLLWLHYSFFIYQLKHFYKEKLSLISYLLI